MIEKKSEFIRVTALFILCTAALPAQTLTPRQLAQLHPQPVEQPDAERTRQDLQNLLQRYPPTLRETLTIDPGLLENEAYLASYPALANYLDTHPEVARNPRFFIGENERRNREPNSPAFYLWRDIVNGTAVFIGFGMGISLLVWLIRTLIDYRRWIRVSKVQTDFHAKLLDRFTASNDLLAYVQSSAGARFLQSAPISLDTAPRTAGAPLARILWSLQGGVVLLAGGVGLRLLQFGSFDEAAIQPLHALGALAVALGAGFIVSAIISFMISRRLGLIESPTDGAPRTDHVS